MPVSAADLAADPAAGGLPHGVRLRALDTHRDARGAFTELWRDAWEDGSRFVQWNGVASRAGVLRGVHLHPRHADYLVVVAGEMILGMHDMRPGSPTAGASRMLRLAAGAMRAVMIPPGVAHGFLFPCDAFHVYAVSRYWDPNDELGCHWAEPELGLAWPIAQPLLSPRDRDAGGYAALRQAFDAALAASGR